MKKRTKLLLMTVFAMLLSLNFSSVSSSSTISQSYEHTVYMESASTGEMQALFTYRVGISIKTEPDGTWTENKQYQVIFSVQLEWFDSKLFPLGISLVFPNSSLFLLGYSYASYMVNTTRAFWQGLGNPVNLTVDNYYGYDWYEIGINVGEAARFQGLQDHGAVKLRPRAGFYLYNSSWEENQIGFEQWFNSQNSIWVTVKPEPEEDEPLSESNFQESIERTLSSLQLHVVMLEIGIVAVVVLLLIQTYFLRRRAYTPTG